MKTIFTKSKIYLYSLCSLMIVSLGGCGGSNPTPAKPTADFPKNTEWVGTLNGNGFQYRPPCSLKFNSDETFTMYGLFVLPGIVRRDSITGTISGIETLPDGRMRITTDITASFNGGATKYLYITDKKKIQGFDSSLSFENFQLSLFPAQGISVAGHWSGPAWKGGVAYPDLSPIQFDNSNPKIPVTHYTRNGNPVLLVPNDPLSGLLGSIYQQKGARVYFSGYNEEKNGGIDSGVGYFGVLLPDGNNMLVHSVGNARLPVYVFTNEPWGQNGATPIIIRK
jgi:hypothetical protein